MADEYVLPRIAERSAALPIDTSPTAEFDFEVDGLAVRFFDRSTDVPPGRIVRHLWTFGEIPTADFTYADASPPAHTMQFTDTSIPVAGTAITRHFWDFGQLAAQPHAQFRYTPLGLSVSFVDESTVPAGRTIASRIWSFGDGQTSAASNPTHVYASSGTYNVSLTVTDSTGATDTATTSLGVVVSGEGRPFGPFNLLIGVESKETVGVQHFNLDHSYASPSNLVRRIEYARRTNMRLATTIPGNSHSPWIVNGRFNETLWNAGVDSFNTTANRAAVAAAVADGTIPFNSMIDEPTHSSWGDYFDGPGGKAKLDRMARKIKSVFPTLPCFPIITHWYNNGHTYNFGTTPDEIYQDVDGIIDQWDWWQSPNGPQGGQSGNIDGWIAAAEAVRVKNSMQIVFSMNIVHGSIVGLGPTRLEDWYCPTSTTLDPITQRTGGRGTSTPGCRHTPEQTEYWGKKLVAAGSALLMWKYNSVNMASGYQAAYAAVKALADSLPVKSFRRT
jgi:PKD repeat protein